MNFNQFGLKKLLASCYIDSPIANTQLSLFDHESAENKTTKHPHKIEITEMADDDASDLRGLPLVEYILRNRKNALTRLQGDGDFRSPECLEMLKGCDIVVTNPPFSLFREYVAQLMEYDKKFLIIGNKNAITYKEIFKLIKENKMWIGRMPMGADMLFNVPEKYSKNFLENKKKGSAYRIVDGVIKGRSQACWFTNIDHKKRHEKLKLFRKYTAEKYPHYDNYDAIEVAKVSDIPEDWDGVMGVPITFLDKYDPEQFEIVGCDYSIKEGLLPELIKKGWKGKIDRAYINGDRMYSRILIKRKQ
jgi:hypothetical protein